MNASTIHAQQVYKRCDELAAISQSDSVIDRRYLTPQHAMANRQVANWMQQAGMKVWQDEAANQWGSYRSELADAPTLILGSHLDTVPNSGKYDGILGVLLPIAAVQILHDNQVRLPFHLDIVGFGDEEGTRFGTTLLGSRAIAGTWQQHWASLKDADGVCVAEAMRQFGLDINQVGNASRVGDNILGFVEVHIEQGPVLEARELPVGVVTGIAGARRFNITVNGQAGHAGTVPMSMRRDAMVTVSEMILSVESTAKQHDVVATVGKLEAIPNAVNVICGSATFSLDVRSQDDKLRDQAIDNMFDSLKDIARQRGLQINIDETHSANGVACNNALQQGLSAAIEQAGYPAYSLPSGAGHDAMAMSSLCPIGMLFTRCDKGISHHPAEHIPVADIHVALDVLLHFIKRQAKQQI